MKKMLLLITLSLLAVQVYSLNANASKRSDEVVVVTTLEPGPDLNKLTDLRVK